METFGFVELRGDPMMAGGFVELAGKVFEGWVAIDDAFHWLVSPSGQCSPVWLDVLDIEFYGQLADEATLGLAVLLRLRSNRGQTVEPGSSLLGCRPGDGTAQTDATSR